MGILDSLENSPELKGVLGQLGAAVIPVVLGEVMGNGVAVLNGVSRGDRVIVTGANQLIDGERVRVIP